MTTIIYNGEVVNERTRYYGYVVLEGQRIKKVASGKPSTEELGAASSKVDAHGGYIMAGVIDDQVHFRDPGLTYKGDIESESRAAVAGGVTSFMDMPNTVPQTTTRELWEKKMERAAEVSRANYGFFFGANNDNIKEIATLDTTYIPGVKVFMGSSTGGMLVDNTARLEAIFAECPTLVATHCEDEGIVRANIEKYGAEAKISDHPLIRSAEACYRSSGRAVEIASKYGTRLHVLHLSTARELSLFESKATLDKKITNEVCVHHLWFSDDDYAAKGNFIKWNPAIKTAEDRDALRDGLLSNRVDIVATDHAPHSFEEKSRTYREAPSGGPMVQHSLVAMLELYSPEKVIEYMAHRVADCLKVSERGYLREGYYGDVVVVEKEGWRVSAENILYKCGWAPLLGTDFSHKVTHTFVSGLHLYDNGQINDSLRGEPLKFKN